MMEKKKVKCPHCGHIQETTCSNRTTCSKCYKYIPIKYKHNHLKDFKINCLYNLRCIKCNLGFNPINLWERRRKICKDCQKLYNL